MSILQVLAPRTSYEPQSTFAAQRAAYHDQIIEVVCAFLIAVCFWFAVPYVVPLQLDPDPMRAAANEAAAYECNVSRQLAMPLVMLVSAYVLYRLPKAGEFSARGRLLLVSCAYLIWAAVSFTWSGDPAITRKRLVVFGINVLFVVALARVAELKEITLLGFSCTGVVALIALWADVVLLHTFSPLNPDYRFMGVMTANFQAMQKVSASQGWVVPDAHNTYLDQTLSLGLIGCFLYSAMLFGACWVAWKRYGRNRDALSLFPALLLSWLALLSFTESIPLAHDLPTLLAYTCIAKMCMTEQRERAVPSPRISWIPGRLGATLPFHFSGLRG